MSATALISGRLWRNPERKTSKAGKQFVTATIREGNGDAVTWWKILCFSESDCEELLRLGDGDGVAVSGDFKVETYDKGGELRLSHTIFAERVISARRQKKKRENDPHASDQDSGEATHCGAPFNDDISFRGRSA
jgi:single-stranded DNA-binding protein